MQKVRLGVVFLTLCACRPADRPAAGSSEGADSLPSPLPVIATGTGFDAADSIPAGWYRVRFSQSPAGRGQNLVLLQVDDSLDLGKLAGALDTMTQTPAGAVARGGSESPAPGDTISLIMELPAGRYAWTSLTRAPNRRRHVTNGVWRELRVTPTPAKAPGPLPTVRIGLTEHAFLGDDSWTAGAHRIGITNQGTQDHLFFLVRLRGDYSLSDWLNDDAGETSDRVAGVSRLGPGQGVQLEVTLAPGRYVASCLITDPTTGKSHTELGMVRLITVTEAPK